MVSWIPGLPSGDSPLGRPIPNRVGYLRYRAIVECFCLIVEYFASIGTILLCRDFVAIALVTGYNRLCFEVAALSPCLLLLLQNSVRLTVSMVSPRHLLVVPIERVTHGGGLPLSEVQRLFVRRLVLPVVHSACVRVWLPLIVRPSELWDSVRLCWVLACCGFFPQHVV